MAVSSAIMLALLMLPVEFTLCSGNSCTEENEEPLTVHLIDSKAVPVSNSSNDIILVPELVTRDANSSRPSPSEVGEIQSVAKTNDGASQLAAATQDWTAVVARSVKASTDERLRLEDAENSKWQKSRSILFQSGTRLATNYDEPELLDIKFKRHVAGLGIRIGSCFIGLPLAGVPVHERTVAITLFVCGYET
jgi:hypothetical protein